MGCGNGKYLAVNRDIFIVGSDRYAHNSQGFHFDQNHFLFRKKLYALLFTFLIRFLQLQINKPRHNRFSTPTALRHGSRHPLPATSPELLRLRHLNSCRAPPLHHRTPRGSHPVYPRPPQARWQSASIRLGSGAGEQSARMEREGRSGCYGALGHAGEEGQEGRGG